MSAIDATLWCPPGPWTPPRPPWRRLPALFSGKAQRGSDGKIRRDPSDGKVRTHDPANPKPCCCSECLGCKQNTVTLVASGIVTCGCVVVTASLSNSVPSMPNGTFTLTLLTSSPTDCVWESGTVAVLNGYSNGTCSGSPSSTDNIRWRLAVSPDGAGGRAWKVYCYFNATQFSGPFYSEGSGDCAAGLSFSNLNTCGGGGFTDIVYGHGGSVTVSFP